MPARCAGRTSYAASRSTRTRRSSTASATSGSNTSYSSLYHETPSSNTSYQPTRRPSNSPTKRCSASSAIFASGNPSFRTAHSRTAGSVSSRSVLVTLGFGRPRGRGGQPSLATKEDARRILQRLEDLSHPFATRVKEVDAVGGGFL